MADVEPRIADLNDVAATQESNFAGASAPVDNAVEGKLWCDTTNDPATLKFDPDGSGADTPLMAIDPGGAAESLRTKVIEIGDWNMDTATAISVTHNLTLAKIRNMFATIRNDDDNLYYHFPFDGGSAEDWIRADGSSIVLTRKTGGIFDDAVLFNSLVFNRGWVTIVYAI